MDVLDIARVCHEANRALCEGLGDFSQKSFNDAPEWQCRSAIDGVEFNIKNPDVPTDAVHNAWLVGKKAAGWKYGETKDEEKKEHPCFVPYDQLPTEQQTKDHLFKAIVAALRPLLVTPL